MLSTVLWVKKKKKNIHKPENNIDQDLEISHMKIQL